MRAALGALLVSFAATGVYAAGSVSSTPPKPTKTTTECAEGLVWDEDTATCLKPQDSSFTDDERYSAVRELAYADRYVEASAVLDTMTDQRDDRVLTYRGFLARMDGNLVEADRQYLAAIDKNPDNILARSYYGQGLVERGLRGSAIGQLYEIRARGGRGTWAEEALQHTLDGGYAYGY
ncbi:MAG: hypothetical protein AAF871_07930 [Pseudomonadota bacterium]